MKVQFSKVRVIPDAMTCWYEHGPEVDLVMDLKKPGFALGSVDRLYVFHVVDHLFPKEVIPALAAWKELLAPGATMFIVNDDFEFLCRSFVGGDIGIRQFNEDFSHPMRVTKELMAEDLQAIGVHADNIAQWFKDVPNEFRKQEFELVMSITNV